MAVRDVKFRAWNGEKMVQIGLMGLHTENNNNPSIYIDMPDTDQVPKYSDCPVMQFTGLIDKNGVEIYEGDILGDSSRPDRIFKGIVEWHGDKWNVATVPGRNHLLELKHQMTEKSMHYDTVIGNVYQNKDLL